MPASAKKAGTKHKTASSYTYTGCWTCRRRHVKCDEGKPACNRCNKSGFECAGYDFKFAGSDSSRTFRRPVAPGSSSQLQPALSSAQVSGYLDALENVTSGRKGPFSVLSFGGDQVLAHERPKNPTTELVLRHDGYDLDDTLSRDSGYQSSRSAQAEDIDSIYRSHTESPKMLVEPTLLSVSTRQSELFEHWSKFVCNNLSPLSASSSNPFRYVYPSLALEGVMSSPDSAGPRLAVWHGICGTAAWSLSKLKPNDTIYHKLSVHHDQLALHYIQKSIEDPYKIDAAIPAAIMTCLTGDTISGRLDSWGRHLKGGFQCLLSVLAHQKPSSTTSVLSEQYLLAAALARFGSPGELRALQNGVQSSCTYMEECHCITRPMINVIVATNVLATSQKRNDPAHIDKIRQTLVRSVPRFQENPTKFHLSHVWYYAAAIHFTRTLLDSNDTLFFALKAVEHLEWAKDTDENGSCGRIMMWPLLTIGMECTTPGLRARLFEWCNSQLQARQKVKNIENFLVMLRDTWTPKPPLEGTLPIREIKIEDEDELG